MQRVVLVPSARMFLVLGSSYLRGRKILAPCKLLSLGRSYTDPSTRDKRDKNGGGSVQWLMTAIKADHFVWSNPQVDYCVNSAET